MKLYENVKKTGCDKEGFMDVLNTLSAQTTCQKLNTCIINLFSIQGFNEEGAYGFIHKNGGEIMKATLPLKFLVEKLGMDKTFLCELMGETDRYCPQVLAELDGTWYYVSDNAINTMAQRAGCAKTQSYIRSNFPVRYHRDGLLQTNLYYYPGQAQMLVRKDGNARKIFALFSQKYSYVNQYAMMCELLDTMEEELGASSVRNWEINHIYTDICLEFPEKAEEFSKLYNLPQTVVPGIRVHTSDVGESSVIINGTVRTGKGFGYIPMCTVKEEHSTALNVRKIMDEVDRKIYPEFCKIPERMIELLQIDIEDPRSVIGKVFQDLGYRKSVLLGNKKGKELLEDLILSVSDNVKYTAYDVAMVFMDIPSMLDESEFGYRNMDAIREAGVSAVLYPYETV